MTFNVRDKRVQIISLTLFRRSNPRYQRSVGQLTGACEFLSALGFVEVAPGTDSIVETGAAMTLQRNDPGLLWWGRSLLEKRREQLQPC